MLEFKGGSRQKLSSTAVGATVTKLTSNTLLKSRRNVYAHGDSVAR